MVPSTVARTTPSKPLSLGEVSWAPTLRSPGSRRERRSAETGKKGYRQLQDQDTRKRLTRLRTPIEKIREAVDALLLEELEAYIFERIQDI